MDSTLKTTIKGAPLYMVAIIEQITALLPVIILWLTALYGLIQLILVSRQLMRDWKGGKNEPNIKDNF